ncbi:primosomal protein N' [Desulfitobacterium sp. PCE1]|uniref:primosomal protein N' n=1 Tax=Desulfitobacterium sp. PCE1 TaxID=146907 RepID=UPI0003697E39|nr:primosomal protein N' [Desulfitobacterium sp. PCE1]
MHYAEVLVDVANRRLDQVFHYQIPEGISLKRGMRVLVPLQYRQVQGVVVRLTEQLPQDMVNPTLKPILGIVDTTNVVPEDLMDLALWLAETTICSIAQSLHTVWPLLKGKVEEYVLPLASQEDEDVKTLKILDSETYQALAVLFRSRNKALPLSTYLKRSGLSKTQVEQLAKQGWIKLESRFTSGVPRSVQTALTSKERVFNGVEDIESMNGTPHEAYVKFDAHKASDCRWELTPEQAKVCGKVTKALEKQRYETLLLHGVTGSGKTEVYQRLIGEVLAKGGSAILLVPEISLTSQIARYFQEQFGEQLIVLHSGLQVGEKAKAWQDILQGKIRVVIGARSAVFAPLPNLRLIILDEEHEGAYRQEENPKYHARNVARKRMEQLQGVVLLGSATPSLEAYAAAQTGKVPLLVMENRVNQRPLPPVEVVDMREELIKGNRSMFSFALQDKLKRTLERGEQCMLFLNRRGYSTFVVCRECGYVIRCHDCDIALTYHSQGNIMRCHYCNHEEIPPRTCPECGSRYIRFFGQGTQRVEDEIKGLYPAARILRLDFDTTRSKDAYEDILGKFRRQEADILVGTQMMAKGLDFPNVTLVGVVAADQMLNMPDFRARERTFQLLTQVAGRAGRSQKPGQVVIQTYAPEDRAIIQASQHNFKGFFWEEIGYRKARNYPPFTHVIRVTLIHEKEERVVKGAHSLASCLKLGMVSDENGNTSLDILGPAPAVMPRLKNHFRWQVSVKGKSMDALREFLHEGVQRFARDSISSGIQLNIEVDPLSM